MKSLVFTAALLVAAACHSAPDAKDLFANSANWEKDAAEQLSNLKAWEGLSRGGNLPMPGKASFTYPDGEKGWYRAGLAHRHDGSGYWRNFYGVRFDIYLPNNTPLKGEAIVETAARKVYGGSEDVVDVYSSAFGLVGKGWHTVTIPLKSFNLEQSMPVMFETIKTFAVAAEFADGSKGKIKLRNPHLVKGDILALESNIRSASAKGGEEVVYTLNVSNCTDQPQVVNLARRVQGREVMDTVITPAELTLAPGETQAVEVRVTVSERVAPGGREVQTIQAMANGRDAGTIEYITLSYLEHPYLLHTKARWDDIREKAATVEWAKEAAQKYIDDADQWEVPVPNVGKLSRHTNQEYVYELKEHEKMFGCAVAYQLTGEMKYAEKAARYLQQLSDPLNGYARTQAGAAGNLVKEGGFMQYVAWSYDLIYNSGALSEEDHENMAATIRLYSRIIDQHISQAVSGNWQVAEAFGAIYGALAIQDMVLANRFIEGPGGFHEQATHGVMADGWWYECSIGYNAWVSSEFTQLALALQPWGIDYVDAAIPTSYSVEYNIFSQDVEERKKKIYGKPFQKWGPVYKPYVKIKDMWDALPKFIDYQGMMFANNDSTENKFTSDAYEIAYFVYGDPTYASIIKQIGKRDLLYGVAELPENTPELGEGSAFADNAGQVMMRSTQEEPRERIQAVLKYGTHGGYHGHFDRISLNSLMRYGRSFYNPEHIWYSYPNFMYAFFVQTSLPHNMVVVDMKQQEAVESAKLLFSEGELLQTTAVETKARWSNPPYGGLKYPALAPTLQEKCWDEGRYLPQPENEPVYGSIGEWSDRVTQRRLLAVADDYVVLVDYLDAPENHTYDCLFNIKGFQGLEADNVSEPRHTESMNPDPILAAQLITDCSWYETEGTTKVSFETKFGPDADNEGTRITGLDGVLKMDVYNAWPKQREVMIGTLPEAHGVNRKFWYSVSGDDQVLAEGKFGAWILGRDEIDVSLEGLKTLTLNTRTDARSNSKKTLFWGNPVIVTEDGNEIALSDLELSFDQIAEVPEAGKDYYGGPIKLSGLPMVGSVPANPVKENIDGTITLDLTGLNAVRFKAFVGGDYPLGNEAERRKSLSFRTSGKQTEYITVIEPFENENCIESVDAASAGEVTIQFKDGRTHVLTFQGLENGSNLQVSIQELQNGTVVREETHSNQK
ncbi:heparinase II/III family protein [Pontiellaceae bacterium B12219]|nr:heparinase II/III family protein [Pontiellaceae bacterium B12219]